MDVKPLDSLPPEWEPAINFAPTGPGGQLKQAIFGDDARLSVRFYARPYVDEFKTEENLKNGILKKEIYYKEHVRIQPIGDRTTIYDQPARDSHKKRFPVQYQAFKSGKDARIGIPIESWDYDLTETEILTFKLLGIEYVHQIAQMNDVQQNSLGLDSKSLIARAKLTVAETSEKEAAAQLQAKFDEQEKKMLELKEENERIISLLRMKESLAKSEEDSTEKYIENVAKKKGRPRKIEGELAA